MSDTAAGYLLQRLVFRITEFFHHWYVDGVLVFVRHFFTTFTSLEKSLALRITLHHFREPLYRDYTVIGWILGPIFRTVRVLVALAVYAVLILIYFAAALAWCLIPVFIVAKILRLI